MAKTLNHENETQEALIVSKGFNLEGIKDAEAKKAEAGGGGYGWIDDAKNSQEALLKQTEKLQEKRDQGVGLAVDADEISAIQKIIDRRTDKWNLLSSVERGAKDKDLDDRAHDIAEKKKMSSIEANDEARKELLRKLGGEISEKEIKAELKEIKKEREKKEAEERERQEAERLAKELAEKQAKEFATQELMKIAGKFTNDREKDKDLFPLAEKSFEVLTGEKLNEKARIAAEKEWLKIKGHKIIRIEEWKKQEPKRIENVENRIKTAEKNSGIIAAFYRLPKEEQAKYFGSDKKLNKEEYEKFKNDLEDRRKKSGIPEDVFYDMSKRGFIPEKTIKRGFWRKMFNNPVEIPFSRKGRLPDSFKTKEDFDRIMKEEQERIISERHAAAEKEVKTTLVRGQKRLGEMKYQHKISIIKETVAGFETKAKSE
ncbi:MAG: hypothetical protein CEN87_120 [Parcubacteria group bacterium Licking1014_1]|nr:MAG: hypothetical protein CEN87_120 [Parcubacteria group bacterium Licking1014_1]